MPVLFPKTAIKRLESVRFEELKSCVNRKGGPGLSFTYPVLLPSLISPTVSVNVKHHERKKERRSSCKTSLCRLLRLSLQSGQSYLDKRDVSYPARAKYRVTELTIWDGDEAIFLERSEVFEKRETPPVDTKPRTSHHWSPGGREAWKEEALDDLPWNDERAIVNQTNIAIVSKGNFEDTSQRRGGAHIMGAFPSAQIYHLELTETGTKAPFLCGIPWSFRQPVVHYCLNSLSAGAGGIIIKSL